MKSLNFFRQKPLNRELYTNLLIETNHKRTLAAVIVDLFFSLLMFISQWYSKNYNPDPIMQKRSEEMFSFARIWLIVMLVCSLFYFLSMHKKSGRRFRALIPYAFFIANILWGLSINLILYILDGSNYLTFYAIFTLFACLLFLIKPVFSFFTLLPLAVLSISTYHLFPRLLGVSNSEALTLSLFLETVICVNILAFVVSATMYNSFLKDFNKTYTIEQLNKELQTSLKTDTLTGILTRAEYTKLITGYTEDAVKKGDWLSVAIMDIDYFKQYNDAYGHLEGDQCLRSIAQCLSDSIKSSAPNAIVARYGGEEFTAAIPGVAPEDANKIYSKALNDIRGLKIEHTGSPVEAIVTISIGAFTTKPTEECGVTQMLKQADELLYKAKDTGRNRVVV